MEESQSTLPPEGALSLSQLHRQKRLAEAMRANLRKRKEQAKLRDEPQSPSQDLKPQDPQE